MVEGATTLEITTNDNKKYEVEVIGTDMDSNSLATKVIEKRVMSCWQLKVLGIPIVIRLW